MLKYCSIAAFAFLLAFLLYHTNSFDCLHQHSFRHRLPKEEIGADVRADWNYLRLRDPQTGEIPRGIVDRERNFARAMSFVRSAEKETGTPTIHTTGWNSAGPDNAGGRTRAIGIDIADEANVLIATAQGGIFRSTDSGTSWLRTTSPGELKNMSSLVQDHRAEHSNTWYAGTGELVSTTWRRTTDSLDPNWHYPDVGNGIYKSTDDGRSWNILPSTVDATPVDLDSVFDGVWGLATDNSRTDSDIVYAAGYGAIMRSNDGGVTWHRALGDTKHTSIASDVAMTTTGVIYAVLSAQSADKVKPSTAGAWRSTDGLHWTNITPNSWPMKAGRMRIAIAPSNENVVYFGGLSDGAGFIPSLLHYTYQSGDGSGAGGTWGDRSNNVPSPTDLHDAGGLNTYGGYAETLRVFPTDENTVFFGGTNLFRSTDGFQTSDNVAWIGGYYSPYLSGEYDSTQSYPNHHPDNHDLQFLPSDPNTLYSANDGGIFVSHDCLDDNSIGRPIEWSILNTNDPASIVYVVAIDHATPGDSTVLGGFQDQGTWLRTQDNSWTQYDGGDGCFCEIADNKAAYYMSSESGYIDQWFLDADFNAVSATFDFRPGFGTPEFLSPYELDPNNNNQMYYSAGNSIWIDSDLTNPTPSWSLIENAPNNAFISALTVSTVPGQELFYGTSNGQVFRVDQANTFTPALKEITGAAFPKNAFVSCITVDPENADSIVVCFSNYHVISIFASNDGGTSWRNVSGNLEQFPDGSGDGPSVRWVTMVHQKDQELYLCGTSVGLFSTADISGSEVTWTQEGVNTIGYAIVENIDARQSDGFVAIATQGSGVFTAHVVSDASSVNSAATTSLQLNVWPNPVSNVAEVRFSLPNASRVSLRLYDVTGKTIANLAAGNDVAGTNQSSFDCATLPVGSYFVQLETPDAIETRRVIVRH